MVKRVQVDANANIGPCPTPLSRINIPLSHSPSTVPLDHSDGNYVRLSQLSSSTLHVVVVEVVGRADFEGSSSVSVLLFCKYCILDPQCENGSGGRLRLRSYDGVLFGNISNLYRVAFELLYFGGFLSI